MQPPEERRASAARAQLDGLYAKIHDEAAVRALTKLHFDADAWRTVRFHLPCARSDAFRSADDLMLFSAVVRSLRG